MREFKTYNPIVNFTYFLSAIGFSMFMMHPAFLCISLICAIMCSVMETGIKKTLKTLLMLLPFVILMGAINPLFNHRGATILAYFPNGNPEYKSIFQIIIRLGLSRVKKKASEEISISGDLKLANNANISCKLIFFMIKGSREFLFWKKGKGCGYD